jgi:hypothetical protein
MDAQPRTRPAADAAWERVRKHPRLRGESKLAWHFVWQRAGGTPQTVYVTAIDVGGDQGRPKQTGYRALENLAGEGLIDVIDIRDGVWCVYVVDPAELAQARRRTYDAQRVIPEFERDCCMDEGRAGDSEVDAESGCFVHPDSASFVVATKGARASPRESGSLQHPDSPPSVPSVKKIYTSPSPSVPSEPSVLRPFVPSEPWEESPVDEPLEAHGGPPPKSIAAVMPRGVDELVGRLRNDVEAYVAEIFDWVSDEKLRKTPALRVARALVDGTFPHDEYEDARRWFVSQAKAGTLKRARYEVFVGLFKKKFRERGLEWPDR